MVFSNEQLSGLFVILGKRLLSIDTHVTDAFVTQHGLVKILANRVPSLSPEEKTALRDAASKCETSCEQHEAAAREFRIAFELLLKEQGRR